MMLFINMMQTEAVITTRSRFNQSAGFSIEVLTTGWSNYMGETGGCVTCPYTCVKPTMGPDGASLNFSNATAMEGIPSIYASPVMNGCCFASKSKSTVMPDCNTQANPANAEDCGFLYGPTLSWRLSNALSPPKKPVTAILFASIDCENFWAVGRTPIKYLPSQFSDKVGTKAIAGKKMINGGCYGTPTGSPMVLAGCLTEELKFDKSKSYSWDMLAGKCRGLSGICAITNGIWGEHLKCCTKRNGITAKWDTYGFKLYNTSPNSGVHLSGPATTGIVFGGVGLMMCLVHYGAKMRERARRTALMREQEATDDYEEIMTPLTGGDKKPTPLQRPLGPSSLEVSLHEGDEIFRKKEPELLYEGDMY
jgi:hypothetical protein